jgi:cobalt transporter subunit CbtA
MGRFRSLMSVALLSGTAAGLLLFAVQHFTVFPLIEKAEVYESAADHSMPGIDSEAAEWHPAEGAERTLLTAASTVLTGIAFAAVLLGTAAFIPIALDWRKGAMFGFAAYLCVDLAPALGLPPQPPGVAVADLYARQLWWVATVACTAIGLWLLLSSRKHWALRVMGLVGLILPHVIGAPFATGTSSVPAQLVRQFAFLSILTTGIFWIALGSIGGLLYRKASYADRPGIQ